MATRKTVHAGPVKKARRTKVHEKLDAVIDEYMAARKAEGEASAQKKEAQGAIVTSMEHLGLDEYENDHASVTMVNPTKDTIDIDKLRRKVGEQVWRKITTSVLDRAKLDAEVKAGNIKASTVAWATTTEDLTSYPKVTAK